MAETHPVDPVIDDAVTMVGNRFGAAGLEELIALAGSRLVEARQALRELGADERDGSP